MIDCILLDAFNILDTMVPPSFATGSLEMSPSFQALADELDDPSVRPTETQLLKIEQELDQVAGIADKLPL